MRKVYMVGANVLVGLVTVFGLSGISSVQAATQTLVPLDSSGGQGNGSVDPVTQVSNDGRYVVFDSTSSDLVSGDTNGFTDVFVRDTVANTTSLVSVSTSGTQADSGTGDFKMTGNGRYVVMSTGADNLASMTPPSVAQTSIFLRDLQTPSTTLVKAGYWNSSSDFASYEAVAMSEDARFVYYIKSGPNTSGDSRRLYVRDILLGTDTQIDVNASSVSANGPTIAADTSCDGRFVTFSSNATNLVSGKTGSLYDIYLVDTMGTHAIKDITLGANASTTSAAITCDGNYVYFGSSATNLVSGDTDGIKDVFQYGIASGALKIVSTDASGNLYASGCSTTTAGCPGYTAAISEDGRYFVDAYSKTSGGKNYIILQMKDTVTNALTRISQSTDNYSRGASTTSDGRVTYYVAATDGSSSNNMLYVATSYL